METHHRPIRKNKTRRRINQVLIVICLLFMFSFGFFIGNRIAAKRNTIVSAANTAKNTEEDAMNPRERKMDTNTASTLNTDESPGEYKPWNNKRSEGKKVAYLTFDDGPSSNNTPKILDILKQNNIKATFLLLEKMLKQVKVL
nr:polysaccharide deacetylase family protein [Clostridium sp. DJ247]